MRRYRQMCPAEQGWQMPERAGGYYKGLRKSTLRRGMEGEPLPSALCRMQPTLLNALPPTPPQAKLTTTSRSEFKCRWVSDICTKISPGGIENNGVGGERLPQLPSSRQELPEGPSCSWIWGPKPKDFPYCPGTRSACPRPVTALQGGSELLAPSCKACVFGGTSCKGETMKGTPPGLRTGTRPARGREAPSRQQSGLEPGQQGEARGGGGARRSTPQAQARMGGYSRRGEPLTQNL